MERTYYTLDDIRKALNIIGEGPYVMNSMTFSSFLNACLQKAGYTTTTFTETQESTECFRYYIWPRFYQEVVVYVDSDESEDFLEKLCRTKAGQIFA